MSNPELQQLERELEAAAVHFSMADQQSPILSAVDPAQSASVSEARVVAAARDVLERLDREPVDLLLTQSETGPPVDGVDQRQWRAFLGRVRAQLRAPRPSALLKSAVAATTGERPAARRQPSAFAVAARDRRPGPFGLLVAGTLLIGTLLVIAIRLTTVDGPECDGPDCPGTFAIASGTVEDAEPPVGESASQDAGGPERSDSSGGSDRSGARSELGALASDVDRELDPDAGSAEPADRRTTSSASGSSTTADPASSASDIEEDGNDRGEAGSSADPDAPPTSALTGRSDDASASASDSESTSDPIAATGPERSTTSESTASTRTRQTTATRETSTTRPVTTSRPSTTRPSTTTTAAPTTTTTRPTTTIQSTTTQSTTTTQPTTTEETATERVVPVESDQAGVACPGGSPSGTRDVYRVADDDVLNVRLGPGTGFDIVYGLPPNATGVQVFEGATSGSWIMVLIPGRSLDDPAGQSCGWSHGGFLTVPG